MLKTFKIGGLHIPGNKIAANKPLENIPLPNQVVISLAQSLGAPATPVVNKGDEVKVGTLLAKANGFISANIHSPVSGKVTKIDTVTDVSGFKKEAIFIDVIDDIWEESIDTSDTLIKDCNLSSEEIIEKIANAGIVGLGGATFPANVKLLSAVNKVDTLIINGTECEPYLTDDHTLMLLKGEEILVGTSILMKAIGVKKAYIGIENNKRDVIEYLKKLTSSSYSGIEVVALQERYPQGGEKQLIDALMGRQVSSGKLPADVGCVVQNAGTAFASYEAVQKNKPLVERLITITGPIATNPCDCKIRIGMSVRHILEYFNTDLSSIGKIIAGGPMMGKALANFDVPLTKGISGLLLLPPEQSLRQGTRACIRCGQCVEACPMGLVPTQLMTFTFYKDWDKVEKFRAMDCLECGSCSYVCPSTLPLVDFVRQGKKTVLSIIRNRK